MAATSLWRLGGLSVKELGHRVWASLEKDEIFTRSAALAYYFVLALFPMLLFLTAMLGFLAGPGTQLQQGLIRYLTFLLPTSASHLVQHIVQQITEHAGGGKISLGMLFALWSGTSGLAAIMDALNHCYHLKETRGLVKARAIAVLLSIVSSVLTLTALSIILFGSHLADFVGSYVGMSYLAMMVWKVVQWPLALIFLLLTFAIIYYYGPDVEEQRWEWITPGAVCGILLWIAATAGVKVYLHFSDTYSQYYGSLGGAMVLLLWLYVSGAAFLLGGEVNSEIENAAAKRLKDPDAKAAGEHAPGEKPELRRPAA